MYCSRILPHSNSPLHLPPTDFLSLRPRPWSCPPLYSHPLLFNPFVFQKQNDYLSHEGRGQRVQREWIQNEYGMMSETYEAVLWKSHHLITWEWLGKVLQSAFWEAARWLYLSLLCSHIDCQRNVSQYQIIFFLNLCNDIVLHERLPLYNCCDQLLLVNMARISYMLKTHSISTLSYSRYTCTT